tara:strand:- start:7951 stop:10503 length:2553 start_codon:yes stop_codon:yes gene_type:complete
MILPIGKFDGGVITNADPEDISNDACINMLNLRTDVSGKLVKQKGHSVVQSLSILNSGNPFVIDRIIQWTHPKLTNGYGWIFYEKTAKKIWFADYNYTNILLLKTFTGTQPDNVRIEQVGQEVRIAMGLNEDSQIIQFLKDRKFFNGQFDPYSSSNTDDDYVLIDKQEPSYPSTWNYSISKIDDNNESLSDTNYHYYKAVPVFDGNQEYKFQDNKKDVFINNIGTNKSIKFKLNINTSDMNKRMTGVNIYRAITANTTTAKSFYKVASSTLNTKQSTLNQQQVTSVTPAYRRFYLINNDITDTTAFNTAINNSVANNPTFDPVIYVYDEDGNTITTLAISAISGSAGSSGVFVGTDSNNSNKQFIKTTSHNFDIIGKNWNVYYDGRNQGEQTPNLQFFFTGSPAGFGGSKSGGYSGKRVLFKLNAFTQYAEYDGYLVKQSDGSLNLIKDSDSNAISLSVDAGTSNATETIDIIFSNVYHDYNSNNGSVDITFIDNGAIDQSPHPINETKLSLRHVVAEDVGARRFYGNVILDPETESESHPDFLVYSDLNQPDIHPISNYIQIKDKQGGGILSLKKIGDSLAVLMENGLYQLYIPSNDPKMWSLVESEENIGCIAPYSVVRTKTSIFFASENNIYELTGNWDLMPIGEAIKDIWQGFTEDQKKATTFTYNSKRNTLSCVFALVGGAVANSGIWEYSLDTRTWSKFNNSFTGTNTGKFTFIDKDENVLCYVSNSGNSETSIVKLDSSSSSETLQTTRTTGWINFSSLSNAHNVQLRRFSMSYNSGDTVTVQFYKDGDASTSVFTNNTTFTSAKKQAEIKVPIRCNQIMIKTSTPSSVNDVSINRMEIETDA